MKKNLTSKKRVFSKEGVLLIKRGSFNVQKNLGGFINPIKLKIISIEVVLTPESDKGVLTSNQHQKNNFKYISFFSIIKANVDDVSCQESKEA